jgi:hypothetical protein
MCDEVWSYRKHLSDQHRLINYLEYMESKYILSNKTEIHEHSLYYKIEDEMKNNGFTTLISVYCYNTRTKGHKQIWTCNKK